MKWFRLTENQYFGFFALGLALFILQQVPYIVMPLIRMESNVLMEMQDKSAILNTVEKILGVSCVVVMIFLVRDDAKWFSLDTLHGRVFFFLAMAAIIIYFIGWIFYFNGVQNLPLLLGILVTMPPIYYSFIGLWRKNYVLAVLGGVFLIAHMSNVWNNLK